MEFKILQIQRKHFVTRKSAMLTTCGEYIIIFVQRIYFLYIQKLVHL